MERDEPLKLQVFICTYGIEGMKRMEKNLHSPHPGVEFVICRQLRPEDSENDSFPAIEARKDYRILNTRTEGIATNRNFAMQSATAPVILITDDDISFHPGAYDTILNDFEQHPEADIMSFQFSSDVYNKHYPDHSFEIRKMPRFFYVSAMEIAMRTDRVRGRIAFNEAFGLRTHFKGGEEDIFVVDAMKNGLTWIFMPHTTMYHPGLSTGTRKDPEYGLVSTKGVVFYYRHPFSWPLRMLWRAWHDAGPSRQYRRLRYIQEWLRGLRKARRLKVLPTPIPPPSESELS